MTKTDLYTDVMLDIETLGTSPNAPIFAVAFVPFRRDYVAPIYDSFHAYLNPMDQVRFGAAPSEGAISFWSQQAGTAQQGLLTAMGCALSNTAPVLSAIANYLASSPIAKDVRVWGNGADFDNAVVASLFERYGHIVPWHFRNNRYFLTLKNLFPAVPAPIAPAVSHDALSDALAQAHHAETILSLHASRATGEGA